MVTASEPMVPPLIAAQLNYLLTHSPLSIKVEQIWSGSKNPPFLSDRFTLLIPFCLDYIKWDVIYNAQNPLVAPDIVFSAADESFHPFSISAEGHSHSLKNVLCDWNCKDPSKLLLLIHELRVLYNVYQRKKIGQLDDERLKFEISTIHSREGIEVCMNSAPDKANEVKFSVPLLDIDLNKMVHGCTWKHRQQIFLQVIFPISRKYSLAPTAPRIKLVGSSELKALFPIEDVKLPPWLDGMCMAEYLPIIEDTLNTQIVEAVAAIGARRRFIEALAPLFGRPLEADPVFCRKATVFACSGVFTFLVHLSLSTQFPKQQPVLVLQSSQHFNSQGTPVMSPPLTDYPWSPRWEEPKMAERIYDFLAEECLNFKKFGSLAHV
ncbi:Brisc and brca1-a complex member [Thalictrum thalictroides]|uniref:BRISC and BRCA1-A complex member 2 n=1 Tax=Thalictrum thalictroides TaxID=46969 RepID=A0A7J6VGN4_THATH|nr:Brisc and brca1-a complex member [Thalictrum thalictroides]